MTEYATLVQIVRDGGLAVAVVFLVLGGMRGWYVFRPVHEDVRKERDENKQLLLQALGVARHAVEAAKR